MTDEVLYEFYGVVTDQKRVSSGQPMTVAEALTEISNYFRAGRIEKIYPPPTLHGTVENLARRHRVTRQKIFDCILVATMITNGVVGIYTGDVDHFVAYKEIKVENPFQ